MHKGHTVFSLGKASFVDLSKCTGGGGVGREERDLIVSWFSDEYHHSRNCKKKMPTDTPVERETAAPPSALAKKEVIFPTTLQEEERARKVRMHTQNLEAFLNQSTMP